MLILGVDTSGKQGSIALARCHQHECEIIDVNEVQGGTFSAQLVPQIANLLSVQNLVAGDIEAFAVASGPGSFTGLRVGLAAVKALAEVLHRPIAPVSMLEAVAARGHFQGAALAALDAGRNEVFIREYMQDTWLSGVESLLAQHEFQIKARDFPVITPEAKIAELVRGAAGQVELIGHPRADEIIRRGWLKIEAGDTVVAEGLEANYIRRSDAEIFSQSSKALPV